MNSSRTIGIGLIIIAVCTPIIANVIARRANVPQTSPNEVVLLGENITTGGLLLFAVSRAGVQAIVADGRTVEINGKIYKSQHGAANLLVGSVFDTLLNPPTNGVTASLLLVAGCVLICRKSNVKHAHSAESRR